MNVFLTGAGGFVGGSVAEALRDAGHRVRGLARSAATAERLAVTGIEPVIGTLDDADLLIAEARRSDAVINAASSDHAGAVRALLEGLQGSSKALIHTSGSSVVGDDARGAFRSERTFSEDDPFEVSPTKRPRRDIDLQILSAAQGGVRSVVICPSLIYGTGRGLNPHSVQIPFLASNATERGAVQIVGEGRNVWSNVHIDDVVSLYLLALTGAPAGAFYFAENGECSFADIGAAIARRLGLPSVENLDESVAAERWGASKAHYTLGSNSRVRALRARRELGWAPRHDSVLNWIGTSMPMPTKTTAQ